MNVWTFCIQRPVFTLVLTIAILAFGILGYERSGVDLYPKIEPPVVTITTTLQGANPEIMDQDVTEIIEEEVGTLEGVDTISSSSSESRSQITVTFTLNRDIDVAAQEVRDRVSAVRNRLPRDIDPPLIEKIDPSAQPIMWLAINGDGPYSELSRIVDNDVKEALQGLPGVGGLQLGGFRKQAVRVWLDPQKLEAYAVAPTDVVRSLQQWQVEIPGGRVENDLTESSIKVEGEFETIAGLNQLIVAYHDGAPIRLHDVALAEMGLDDTRGLARFNGRQAIGVGVRKQSGGNTVATAQAVKAALPALRQRVPQWVSIDIAFDASRFIEATVAGVSFDILFGAAITCLVIGLFLRSIRATLISVMAIPTSLIGTFYLTYQLGFTVNQMTLLGMSLAVGLVVDDAIVVIENIERHLGLGRTPREAASVGTGEVAFAVLAATTSIVVIFLPVGFMGGVVGQFFGSFGLTVAMTIIISLVVSWTLTPMLASRFMRAGEGEGRIGHLLNLPMVWAEGFYRNTLSLCLSSGTRRAMLLAAAAGLFLFSLMLGSWVGKEFIPDADDSRFLVIFETPLGSSLEATDAKVREAEAKVLAHPEVQGAFMAIGLLTGQPNSGLFFITLSSPHQRAISQRQLMNTLRQEFASIPGFKAFPMSLDPLRSGAVGAKSGDINYVLQGPDLRQLERMSVEITDAMKADPAFVDVDYDLRLTRPEVQVDLHRDAAADLGVDTREISLAIQTFMGGVDAAKFTERGERYDVRVRGATRDRVSGADLEHLSIRARDNRLFRLTSVVDLTEGVGPNQVNRYNRQRSVSITANLVGIPGGEGGERFLAMARKAMAGHPEYAIVPAGRSKLMAESMNYLAFALIMSIVVVYLVLSAQFESFVHPFTVMFSLPLTTLGVFGGLLLARQTINVYSFIGVIMLVGIVTRNAILLIDRINQNRDRGMTAVAAALEAGPVRLRPILMTSISAVVGLIPVAIGASEGGEARAPMGVAVIGGLLASTFLTLYVIPAVYLTLDGILRSLAGLVQGPRQRD